jgi:hypothetical protein
LLSAITVNASFFVNLVLLQINLSNLMTHRNNRNGIIF